MRIITFMVLGWRRETRLGFSTVRMWQLWTYGGHDWRERRLKAIKGWEWRIFAGFLLLNTVNFVESELVETDDAMKRFDLILRILGEDGSVDVEGQRKIADAYMRLEWQME